MRTLLIVVGALVLAGLVGLGVRRALELGVRVRPDDEDGRGET